MIFLICLTVFSKLNGAIGLKEEIHRVPEVPGTSRDRNLERQNDKDFYNNPNRRYYHNDRDDYDYDSDHHDDKGQSGHNSRPFYDDNRYNYDNRDYTNNNDKMSRPCNELIENLKSKLTREEATLMLQNYHGEAKVDGYSK